MQSWAGSLERFLAEFCHGRGLGVLHPNFDGGISFARLAPSGGSVDETSAEDTGPIETDGPGTPTPTLRGAEEGNRPKEVLMRTHKEVLSVMVRDTDTRCATRLRPRASRHLLSCLVAPVGDWSVRFTRIHRQEKDKLFVGVYRRPSPVPCTRFALRQRPEAWRASTPRCCRVLDNFSRIMSGGKSISAEMRRSDAALVGVVGGPRYSGCEYRKDPCSLRASRYHDRVRQRRSLRPSLPRTNLSLSKFGLQIVGVASSWG